MVYFGKHAFGAVVSRVQSNTDPEGLISLRLTDRDSRETIGEFYFSPEQFANVVTGLWVDDAGWANYAEHPERLGKVREHTSETVPRQNSQQDTEAYGEHLIATGQWDTYSIKHHNNATTSIFLARWRDKE